MVPAAEVETPPTEQAGVPGAYEKFQAIGSSLGIKADFLKLVSDHVFLGDPYDLSYVWDALNGMYLRPDVTKRWFNLWQRQVNRPIPASIAHQVMPQSTEAGKDAEVKQPTRFTIVGDDIIADAEGEFTFSQARQVLMTRVIQNAAGGNVPADRVSDILTALEPYINKGKEGNKSEDPITAVLLKYLLENKNGNGEKPNSLADIIMVLDKVNEARAEQWQ